MKTTIKIIKGDITKQPVDAIVNAANSSLLGGGGVDGAIHRAGGPEILEACKKIVAEQGPCKTGEAVITTGGNLPASFVIHAVGPIWHGGKNNEEQLLANAYLNSLNLAVLNDVRTIAFPNISTGVYYFPKDKAARIALKTTRDFIKAEDIFEEILFVCFDDENFQLYNHLLHLKE
ncbi:MAG TPA: O-acetyl-ADP-ribose deacetylase [Parafilimonas sp.]|nr:O-acetyl-ADP-ribose deacetylase [Parafilimonas sp.]